MAVSLFVTPTLAASSTTSPQEFSDSLAGGGTGINLGQVANGLYAPIVDQATNDGAQVVYLSHNAAIDPITDVKVFISQYSQTYGGAVSSLSNYTQIKAEGQTSTSGTGDKNNSNGTSSGLWVDFDQDVSQSNQFDIATRPSEVKIFGKSDLGIDALTAYALPVSASMYAATSASEAIPSAPVAGKIGKSSGTGFGGDSALGNRAKFRTRIYLRSAFPDGGIYQVDYSIRYSFTA